MQIGPGDQFDGRADQVDILVGDPLPEVDAPLGQHGLVQVTDAPGVGIGLRKIKEPDPRFSQQITHER